ncbi:MAG: hypothetical protein WCG87_06805 [Bacteroidota bacterium]
MKQFVLGLLCVGFVIIMGYSCKYDHAPVAPVAPSDGNFPPEVAKIFINKCATAGCHNQASYQNAAGLLLDTWEHLFNGDNSGSVVIPYSLGYSNLLFFINTDSTQGPKAVPTMPLNAATLSKDEYNTIKNWIAVGAPDKKGNIAFSSSRDTRQKIYISQQGCDVIAVVDAKTKLTMRIIPVGMDPNKIEVPHSIETTSDGKYAYVSFVQGTYLQKIDLQTDSVVASLDLNLPGQELTSWGTLNVSDDGNNIMVSYYDGTIGNVILIDAVNMVVLQRYGAGAFVKPHGTASLPTFDTFYVSAQNGNIIYKISKDGTFFKKVTVDGAAPTTAAGTRDLHEIEMASDGSKYFVTCQASNEVRVMDAHADTLIKAIPVGIYPQDMAISNSTPYLFVTCEQDNSTHAGFKGSVFAINYNTYETIRIDGDFYQPNGIAVDDQNGLLYIVSRNLTGGVVAHHTSICGGNDGWYNVYDLKTFKPLNNIRYEGASDSYDASTRFE